MIKVPLTLLLHCVQLSGHSLGHKCVQLTGGHRITHSHIDSLHIFRNSVQKRHQQSLVRKHYSTIIRLSRKSGQQLGHALHLTDS